MGNIEHIDRLETYIEELGDQISKVKKASEYLKLIEGFQAEVTETSATLSQSSNQLKLYQEIMDSKLELFLTTSKNIEGKQQAFEQTQSNIIGVLSEIKKSTEETGLNIVAGFSVAKDYQDEFITELIKVRQHMEDTNDFLINHIKTSKLYFIVIGSMITAVIGLLIYLLVS
ncbi:MAG: hypothetical protein GX796_00930 [Clostridiaceae bacterium]|jgi:hypothetical protein|nr:hypothetical protein [Clostridiaceae bacterium]